MDSFMQNETYSAEADRLKCTGRGDFDAMRLQVTNPGSFDCDRLLSRTRNEFCVYDCI